MLLLPERARPIYWHAFDLLIKKLIKKHNKLTKHHMYVTWCTSRCPGSRCSYGWWCGVYNGCSRCSGWFCSTTWTSFSSSSQTLHNMTGFWYILSIWRSNKLYLTPLLLLLRYCTFLRDSLLDFRFEIKINNIIFWSILKIKITSNINVHEFTELVRKGLWWKSIRIVNFSIKIWPNFI